MIPAPSITLPHSSRQSRGSNQQPLCNKPAPLTFRPQLMSVDRDAGGCRGQGVCLRPRWCYNTQNTLLLNEGRLSLIELSSPSPSQPTLIFTLPTMLSMTVPLGRFYLCVNALLLFSSYTH